MPSLGSPLSAPLGQVLTLDAVPLPNRVRVIDNAAHVVIASPPGIRLVDNRVAVLVLEVDDG